MNTNTICMTVVIAATALVACGSDESKNSQSSNIRAGGSGGGGSGDGGSYVGGGGYGGLGDGGLGDGGLGDGGLGDGGLGDGGGCAWEPNEKVCTECCAFGNVEAATELHEMINDKCYCGAGAPCAAACAADCGDLAESMSDECETCIDGIDIDDNPAECASDAYTACLLSPTCSPFILCWDGCL